MASSSKSTVAPQQCSPGDVLAEDVTNDRGQTVIPKGQTLTEESIRQLIRSSEISYVTIESEYESDDTGVDPSRQTKMEQVETEEEGDTVVIVQDLHTDYIDSGSVRLEGDLHDNSVLTARGEIELVGDVHSGTVRSLKEGVTVQGEIMGEDTRLISEDDIEVDTVEGAKLTVKGNLLVRGAIRSSVVECIGNLACHSEDRTAEIIDSELEIRGKMVVDHLGREDEGDNSLTFHNPERLSIQEEIDRINGELENQQGELETRDRIIKTIKKLGQEVRELSEEKRQKLKTKAEEHKELQVTIESLQNELEQLHDQRARLDQKEWRFLRVLERLDVGTEAEVDGRPLNINQTLWDVEAYSTKRPLLRDQDAVNFDLEDWLHGD